MITPKIDRLRHAILEILITKFAYSDRDSINEKEISISSKDLANELGVTVYRIREACAKMMISKEVQFKNFGRGEELFAGENGFPAYAERKYIKEGRKEFNDTIFNITKWLAPSLSLVISIIALSLSIIAIMQKLK